MDKWLFMALHVYLVHTFKNSLVSLHLAFLIDVLSECIPISYRLGRFYPNFSEMGK